MKTQQENILQFMQEKTITPIEALNLFGCFRLAAIIFDLRAGGHFIITETVRKNGKRFARYKLVQL